MSLALTIQLLCDLPPRMKYLPLKKYIFLGWFYKLALLDFELIFEVKMQESEGV